MTTHTPGPWRVVDREMMEDGSVYPCHILGGVADFQVCTLESPAIAKLGVEKADRFPGLNGVLGPNARLLAAAPELLEALEAEEEWRSREAAGELDPEWDYETMVAAKRRASIAKATGA